MLKSKKKASNEHAHHPLQTNSFVESTMQKTQGYVVKNTIHWKEILRVISVFFISFFVCFFLVRYIYVSIIAVPKKKNSPQIERKITSIITSISTSFSQSIKAISVLLPKKKYDFYQTKRQFIDPVLLKEVLDNKDPDTLLVDIRSAQEYKSAHIKTAISAPAYTNSQDVYESLTQKSSIRAEIYKGFKGKRLVIVYGYRPDSDISQDVYEDLKQVFPVRVLDISWNDWKNNFYSWLPNAEKQNFLINAYIEGTDVIQGVGLPHL